MADALRTSGSPWPAPVVLPTTGSTNDDVAALAAGGAPEGTSVTAEEQTAGRGRLDRVWSSPAGAGLWTSVLVRAGGQPKGRWGLLPLVAGLAAVEALDTAAGVAAALKWPNDVVVTSPAGDLRKLGGILCQTVGDDGVIIGMGLNVSLSATELPVPTATSVLVEGGRLDRAAILVGLLSALRARLQQWRADDPVLLADYRRACVTVGRQVDVAMPDGSRLAGHVVDVDDSGHLLVDDGAAVVRVAAGDVVHASL